jgi:hypothetical protein
MRTDWYNVYSINTIYMGSKLRCKYENLTVKIQPLTSSSLYHFVHLIYAIPTHSFLFYSGCQWKWRIYLLFTMPAMCWVSTCQTNKCKIESVRNQHPYVSRKLLIMLTSIPSSEIILIHFWHDRMMQCRLENNSMEKKILKLMYSFQNFEYKFFWPKGFKKLQNIQDNHK